jgi:ketosteroid isomerase-like protein
VAPAPQLEAVRSQSAGSLFEIRKVVMIRKIFLPTLVIVVMASCGVETPVTPREPASAAEVEQTSAAFKAVTNAWDKAYASKDLELIRATYTDDIEHHDETLDAHIVGIDDIEAMTSQFITFFPSLRRLITDWFIGSEDSLAVYEYWNLSLGGHKFTQEDPMVMVFLLETRGDRISDWTLFYDLETIEKSRSAPSERLEKVESLLSSYGSAWSSGNSRIVGDLYAGNAVREDTIFGERQEGREAVSSASESFFAWYSGAQWILLLPFGVGQEDAPMTGGLFEIAVTDTAGQPCKVQTVVLLKTSNDQIVHETLYYEPNSLIACGWTQ